MCHSLFGHMSGIEVPPFVKTASLSPLPGQRKDGTPSCQVWLKVGKKTHVAGSFR